jgi:hypothetical protein
MSADNLSVSSSIALTSAEVKKILADYINSHFHVEKDVNPSDVTFSIQEGRDEGMMGGYTPAGLRSADIKIMLSVKRTVNQGRL